MYWMTLHTPLTVEERWRHNYDVFPDSSRTQPFGGGATCAWPVLDLQLENRTDTSFRLGLEVGAGNLSGTWTANHQVPLRYEVYEAAHVMTNEAPGVFVWRNLLRRRTWRLADEPGQDQPLADELITENHALMRYQPFLSGSPHNTHA